MLLAFYPYALAFLVAILASVAVVLDFAVKTLVVALSPTLPSSILFLRLVDDIYHLNDTYQSLGANDDTWPNY